MSEKTAVDKNPLVTFALFSYNQEKYIREAVKAALAQDYSPLEIIISDDCSCDKTFEIICEATKSYAGNHKIIINRNDNNLGVGSHVNLLMQMSSGEFIVGAAGDDISNANRVTRLIEKFKEGGAQCYSVWSSAKYIDGNGDFLERKFTPAVKHDDISIIRNRNPVIGATHAWRKEVFDFFGPLMPGIVFEDNAISFRSYLLGGISFIEDDLVNYRHHDNNLTNFSRNASLKATYNRAHFRVVAKGVGLVQRINDLKIFNQKSGNTNQEIIKSLNEEIKKNDILIRIYKDFPNFKLRDLCFVFFNIEVAKVFIRSLSSKLFGDGFKF